MVYSLKQYFKYLFSSIFFWTLAFAVFITIRYFAIEQEKGVSSDYHISMEVWSKFILFLGFIIGIVYGTIEYAFERFLAKRLFLGLVLLGKSIIYLIFLIFSLSFISHFIELELDLNLPNETGWWKSSETFWLVVGYFFMCSFLFLFIKMVNDKFGRGQLINTLIGTYRKPREKKRIFMFLDLKSSTTIAEELGHFKYSQLIQDCFYDLNKIVNRYGAAIYQYVGDEAVLTWPFEKGIRNNNCIDIFFYYELVLKRKSKYYRKKYNITPEFKAGVHGGKLIVAEVGSIKKEIAYHGDVINTTSRIQELCNKYDKQFLISKELLDEINLRKKYQSVEIGEMLLKGKQAPIKIHSVERFRPNDDSKAIMYSN